MLYFENDYCEGAHPAILQKLAETNFEKVPGYGTDPYCASAKAKICAACGCPDADVTFISGMNGLKLTLDLKRGVDADKLMAKLFKATPLEDIYILSISLVI